MVDEPLLIVDREYGNIHDKDACLVWLPNLECYPEELHDNETDESRHLKLFDVAGLPIGHIPRGLGGCFRELMDQNHNIYAKVTGAPRPSFPPWPAPKDIGGGAVIPCSYIIKSRNTDHTVSLLKTAVQNMEAKSAMTVTVNHHQ